MFKRRIYNLVAGFLIIIVLAISFISVTNVHYHKLPDGSIICHSHPFTHSNSRTPFEKHHHTVFSYLAIEQLNLLFNVYIVAVTLLLLAFPVMIISKREHNLFQFHFNFPSIALRAPPFNSCYQA